MKSMVPVNTRIIDVFEETNDVKSFLLENNLDEDPLPGQFYEIYVRGAGEIPISIASWRDGLLFSVKRVGYVTERLHGMKKGDILGIRGPFGNGFPEHRRHTVLIAGGIGLPPARSYIEYWLSKGSRNMQLLYGARTPSDIVYRRILQEWSNYIDVHITVDKGDKEWKGNVGVVTTIFHRIKDRESDFIIIGPEIMMKFSVMELKKLGVSEDNIYLSMERKMKCGFGICGHCNIGRYYVCKDGPVFKYSLIKDIPEVFH
ncbi:MAG: FAD/NAD(P)-binding protein [Thermoplasmata archaeon]|jgi:NAD(P)H-flavin reductase